MRADAPGADATLDRAAGARNAGRRRRASRSATARCATRPSPRSAPAAIAAIVSGTVTGSTLVAEGAGARALYTSTLFFGGDAAVTVRNTILRGDVSGWDAAVLRHRRRRRPRRPPLDVATSRATAPDGCAPSPCRRTAPPTVAEGAGNVTTVGPLLAGLPGGLDLHQLRGSPTIDAGTAAGTPARHRHRRRSARLRRGDRHRRRRVPAAAARVDPDDRRRRHRRGRSTASSRRAGRTTTWRLEIGRTTAYDATVFGGAIVPKSVESQSVSAPVGGLRAATTYHARLVAVSAKGTTFGPDTTFRTLASPGGASQTAARPTLTRRAPDEHQGPARQARRRCELKSSVAGNARGRRRAAASAGRRKGRACVTATKRCTAAVRVIGIVAQGASGRQRPAPDRHDEAAHGALPPDAHRGRRRPASAPSRST